MAEISSTNNTQTTTTTGDDKTTAKQNSMSEENKLVRHKARYIVSKFALKLDGEEEMIELNPVCINEIVIMQDFDDCIQPIFQIKAVLPPLVIDYLNTNKSTTSIFIRFRRLDFNSGSDIIKLDKTINRDGIEDICNTEFVLFAPDSGKISNLDEYKSVVETVSGKKSSDILYQINKAGENLVNYTKSYQLFLWKATDLYNMRKVVNYVFSNCTVGDAAAGILSQGGFTNILMAPPDNSSQIAQIIVPPMSQMNVFNYLQRIYGMYDTDVLFFSDIDRTYVLDKSGKCKAYADNEYTKTIFSIVDSNTVDTTDVGSSTLDEKMEFHNKVDIDSVSIRSLSSVNDVIRGNNSMYIDSRTNEITTVSGAGEQRGSGCINVTTDQESSEYTKKRQSNMVSELALNLRLDNLIDYNYNALSPNKAFVFSFYNKLYYQYNGYYRLKRATHIFTRMGQGEMMAVMGSFEFVRKTALSEEERSTIEYDVFQTATLTEENKTEAANNADSNNSADPSFSQSETNQVAEGKMEPSTTPTVQSSSAPKDLIENAPEYNKIQPTDDLTVINAKLAAQQKQLDQENSEKSKVAGSPAPTPLNEKK